MGQAQMQQLPSDNYELRFRSLNRPGHGYTFPCDECGRVDMDALSDGERHSYLFARAIIGQELSFPAVQRVAPAPNSDHSSTARSRLCAASSLTCAS
jgi:hypothetical protein